MKHFRILLLIILVSCSLLSLGSSFNWAAQAQTTSMHEFRHPHGAALPLAPNANSPSSFAPSAPTANYDEQLGLTFTQTFPSIAYNVTAIAQSDAYGIGPAYLLNGLSTAGYWYQVGVSYNWPYVDGGHTIGFHLSYNVFNASGAVVLPSSGKGGLSSFSGPVNSGDSILLSLYFDSGNVIMSAKDWNTSATASQTYSAISATSFIGLPNSPSNSNGFFTGLMTEWYHVDPYFGDVTPVTYSNYGFALSSAWMWMDEYNPSDSSWTGKWSDRTSSPVQYSNPNQLQQFSSHGATEYSNAYQFITGSLGTTGTATTLITLLSAGQSTPLSAGNEFAISYISSGKQLVIYAQNGTLTLNSDLNTSVLISGTSTGSTASEKWVLNSASSSISVASGANLALYYYDLLAQSASYTTAGGGNPTNPTLSYYTAPLTASEQLSQQIVTLSLPQSSQQTIWAVRGSTGSVSNPILGSSSERWPTQTESWTLSGAYQLPSPIIYYHQFLLSITGAPLNSKWCNSGAPAAVSVPGILSSAASSRQRVASYSIDGGAPITVKPATGTIAISIMMDAAHQLSINSVQQYRLTIYGGHDVVVSQASPTEDSFYDSGSTLAVATDYTWNVTDGNTRQNLFSYTLDGTTTNVTRAESGNFTTPKITFNSARELTFNSAVQHLASFQFRDNSGTAAIAPTSFQIEINDSSVIIVPQLKVWLDSGAKFQIHNIMWANADVKPNNLTAYTANAPLNETILCRVFNAKLVATDYFGLPISSAQVAFTLANGTTIKATTGKDGAATLLMIPLGTFNAAISHLGTTTTVNGDASTQAVTTEKIFASYPTFGLIIGAATTATAATLILFRRHHIRRSKEIVTLNPATAHSNFEIYCV